MSDLFKAGMADPRGCEYREIVLAFKTQVGWEKGDQGLKAHGWVLPSDPGASPRFAVGWNGVVYPPISAGAPADLDADVESLLARSSAGAIPESRDPTRPPPDECLAYDRLPLVKVPLLLRLGKIRAAEEIWKRWNAQVAAVINDWNRADFEQLHPFTILSHEWLFAAYSYALHAHARDDARLALAYMRRISEQREKVEQIASTRGIALAKAGAHRPASSPSKRAISGHPIQRSRAALRHASAAVLVFLSAAAWARFVATDLRDIANGLALGGERLLDSWAGLRFWRRSPSGV